MSITNCKDILAVGARELIYIRVDKLLPHPTLDLISRGVEAYPPTKKP